MAKKQAESTIEKRETVGGPLFSDTIESFVGQKVALICARYQYRGILSHVGKDHVVLSNSCSVEISGASEQAQPESEDPISGDVIIKTDAVEIFYQPNWVHAPLPHEPGFRTR